MRIANVPAAEAAPATSPQLELTLSNGLVLPVEARPIKALPGAFAMPFPKYLEHPALGRSTLDKIRKSPLNLQHYLEHGELDTQAFLRGRVAHRLLLEPKQFWLETVVWKGGSKTTGEGAVKRWKAFQTEHAGKDIITEAEEAVFLELEERFKSHPLTKNLLVGAQTEAVVFFERDGVQCKMRADILRPDEGEVVDVKTTADLAEFERAIYKWGYHRQGDWYTDGATRGTCRTFKKFTIVAVEVPKENQKTPVDVAVFEFDTEVLEDGREENDENLARFKRCQTTGSWPGFAPVARLRVTRPAWRAQS